MSIKKNVAIVDGKALNAPPTPEKQSSPPAEVKLDDKIVRAVLSDTNIYDLWKKLADDGGMKIYGVKDAAHLEEIINKQGREIILSANVASAKAELEAATSVIRGVLDRYFDDTTRKGVIGRIDFRYDHKNSVWSFKAIVVASAKAELEATTSVIEDVLDRYFDDATRKDVFGRIDFRYDHKNSVWSFKAIVNHNNLLKKKRNGEGNAKRKNGNDLPNAKPDSKKKHKGKGNGKKKKFEQVRFKGSSKKTTSSGKKKYNPFKYRLPGHYGANQ